MDETTGDMKPSDPYIEPILSGPDRVVGEEWVVTGNDVTSAEREARDEVSPADADNASTDDIREGIEQTRANMSGTINAIQDRLSPQRLTQQAKDAVYDATVGKVGQTMNDVTESAREGGSTLLDTIRQNPVPAALAGIGVGWLIMKVRENAQMRSSRSGGRGRYGAPYGQYGQYGQYGGYPPYQGRGMYSGGQMSQQGGGQSLTDKAQDTMSQVANKAQDTMSQAAGKAQDTMSQVTDKAQDMGSQLQDQAQQMANQAQYQAYRAKGWFERTMDDNPLAIGLVAAAAGALAGMAVPETDQEREWMGPARDQLVDKAQDVAQDTATKAQRVAKRATDAAKDAAKDEAQKQNLTQ